MVTNKYSIHKPCETKNAFAENLLLYQFFDVCVGFALAQITLPCLIVGDSDSRVKFIVKICTNLV